MGGKRKGKAHQPVTYLAPAESDPHSPSKFEVQDYDAQTQVKDAFENDLEFLLNDDDDDDVAGKLEGGISIHEVVTEDVRPGSRNKKSRISQDGALSKKLKREILKFDFDVDFDSDSDSDSDGDDHEKDLGDTMQVDERYLERELGLDFDTESENEDIYTAIADDISDEEEFIRATEIEEQARTRQRLSRAEFDSLDAQLNRLTINGDKVSRDPKKKKEKKRPTKNKSESRENETDSIIQKQERKQTKQKKQQTQEHTLLVTNLPTKSKVGQLRKIFEPIGGVVDVRVMTGISGSPDGRRVGFVRFKARHFLDKAIDTFQNYIIDGSPILLKVDDGRSKVNAKEKEERESNGKNESKPDRKKKPTIRRKEAKEHHPQEKQPHPEQTKDELIRKKKVQTLPIDEHLFQPSQSKKSKVKSERKTKSPEPRLTSEEKLYELDQASGKRIVLLKCKEIERSC